MFDPNSIYQEVAPLSHDEGRRTLAEERAFKQAELEQRDKDVAAADAEVSRLQTRHAELNKAAVEAAAIFHKDEQDLMNLLIEPGDIRLDKVAPKHEAKGAIYRAAVAAVKHVATTRLPQALVDRLRAQVARQLAFAELAEATARLCVATKLSLLEPLWAFEGTSLTTTGGISDEAIKTAALEYEAYAKMAANLREAEAKFSESQK